MRARGRTSALLLTGALSFSGVAYGISSLNRADPYPLFTAADQDIFLTIRERREIRELERYGEHEHMQFSVSAYRQSANTGSDQNGNEVQLGNLTGNWNVLGLFYPEANAPAGGSIRDYMLNATNARYIPIEEGSRNTVYDVCFTGSSDIGLPGNTDRDQKYGFFEVPICYRKSGFRMELMAGPIANFGLRFQWGVCDLRQTYSLTDLTCEADCKSCAESTAGAACEECRDFVVDDVMDQFDYLVTQSPLGYCMRQFHITSPEDLRISIFWRQMFCANRDKEGWATFLFTPYATFDAVIPAARKQFYLNPFSISPGNNGHTGLGATAGFTIDFIETVRLGFEGSVLTFDCCRHNCVPVPLNPLQNGIYQRFADLVVKPGTNWTFGATLAAYQFLDRLSFWAQYVLISHKEDCFTVVSTNAYDPITFNKMASDSEWQVQLANISLWYDISPNVALGFLVQAPIKQKNAYRSTTILGSLILTF